MSDGASRPASLFGTCLCAAALCAWPKPAAAHAPAQATGIFADLTGSGPARSWVRTNRGVILKGAGSEPPWLLCNDAYSAAVSEDVPMIAAPDGLVLASYYGGLLRIASDGCEVAPADVKLDGQRVVDLASTANGARYFALVAPKPGGPGPLLVSADTGRSWQEIAEIPAFGSSLRVAPSDAERLYVTAQVESESGESIHRLFVSADGGSEFSALPITLLDTEVRAFLLAIDPRDSERLLLRVLPGNPESPERVLLSDDGGETLSEVYAAVGPLVATFDEDVVWLGGQAGLFRSDDRGKTFAVVPSALSHVGCLVVHEGALTACGHQDLRFGVFRAAPGQQEFELELGFGEVADVACGAESPLAGVCRANFLDWVQENPPAASGVAGASGAAAKPEPSPAKASSCGLSTPGSGGPLAMAFSLLYGWSRRRSRGSRRPRPPRAKASS